MGRHELPTIRYGIHYDEALKNQISGFNFLIVSWQELTP
jgi:hypothetical protein